MSLLAPLACPVQGGPLQAGVPILGSAPCVPGGDVGTLARSPDSEVLVPLDLQLPATVLLLDQERRPLSREPAAGAVTSDPGPQRRHGVPPSPIGDSAARGAQGPAEGTRDEPGEARGGFGGFLGRGCWAGCRGRHAREGESLLLRDLDGGLQLRRCLLLRADSSEEDGLQAVLQDVAGLGRAPVHHPGPMEASAGGAVLAGSPATVGIAALELRAQLLVAVYEAPTGEDANDLAIRIQDLALGVGTATIGLGVEPTTPSLLAHSLSPGGSIPQRSEEVGPYILGVITPKCS